MSISKQGACAKILQVVLAATLGLVTSAALAASGDQLRQISGAYSKGSCSVNTGIAFNGTNLIISCWNYNTMDVISPVDGHLVSSKDITGFGGFGAIAWDGTRQMMWACNTADQSVVLVDMTAGTGVSKFISQGCLDGLAYDGTDDTIWASGDSASTIQHYTITGTLINSFPIGNKLGGAGNSGIAVGGASLFLANDGSSQIYQVSKDLQTSTLFATFPRRLEDLECDPVSFSGIGKSAIWSIDAYDRTLNAWEIPAGLCGAGGLGVGPAPPQIVLPTDIPTLDWAALVALALLLGAFGVRTLRRPH